MRHATTTWTKEGRFTGWGDAPLCPAGEDLARKAGFLLRQQKFSFDALHTSMLVRARRTLDILVEELQCSELPIDNDWRLNERHYGILQEQPRSVIADQYGRATTAAWRRQYRARPPGLTDDDPRWLEQLNRFPDLPATSMPRSESMEDCVRRVQTYWIEKLQPALRAGKRVLLVAHTCSIRGLVRIFDRLNDQEAERLSIPVALPIVYELDAEMKPLHSSPLYADLKDRWRHFLNSYKPRRLYWS